MTPSIFGRKAPDPGKPKTVDRKKSAGAREYEARVRERTADRLAAAGDADGAGLERAAAAELRREPLPAARASSTANKRGKPGPLVGTSPGVYRINR